MMQSLRTRLILLVVIVLVVAGSLATWFLSRAVRQRFEDYLLWEQTASEDRRAHLEALLPVVLADHYRQYRSWQDTSGLVKEFGELTQEQVILADEAGQVIVDSAGGDVGYELTGDLATLHPITVSGQVVGAFKVLPLPPWDNSAGQVAFVSAVNRSLLYAMSAAGVLALILTLALTRGILRRVRALTNAAQKMQRGDLNQRVPNNSQDEIGRLAHAFNDMAAGLARMEHLRRNMVSDVAHELRTPLSNIRGYLEAMQDGVVEAKPETIQSLYEEAMLLNRLVNDLQQLALAEAGQLKLARQQVPINDLIDKALQSIAYRAGENNIRLRANLPASLPPVQVDAERIGQVLRNLLNNAVEYTPRNGTITVSALQEPGHVQVAVHNDGSGIAPDHLPNLFERFYRVDRSRTRATGGSGLGLAIVKQLVEAHGGRVWAHSHPNQDATFYFTLPVA
jgi:signal transduction histidine kinase